MHAMESTPLAVKSEPLVPFASMGSYAPKATLVVVLIVQLAATDAEIKIEEVFEPAIAGALNRNAKIPKALMPSRIAFIDASIRRFIWLPLFPSFFIWRDLAGNQCTKDAKFSEQKNFKIQLVRMPLCFLKVGIATESPEEKLPKSYGFAVLLERNRSCYVVAEAPRSDFLVLRDLTVDRFDHGGSA